jgi:hypothetical protein
MTRLIRSWHEQHDAELRVDGTTVIERHFGSVPTEDRRDFANRAGAITGYLARLGEMLATGWRRAGDLHENPTDETIERPTDPVLEASIDGESIDTVTDSRDVYLDWLAAQGDPMGELGPLHAALERGDGDRHALLQRIAHVEWTHADALFGPLHAIYPKWRNHVTMRWYRGWVDRLELRFPSHIAHDQALVIEIVHQSLHMAVSRFVRWLDLDAPASFVAGAVLHSCPIARAIRGLRIADEHGLVARLPGLRQVELIRGLPPLDHEGLQSIEVNIDHASGRPKWPALRRLVCHATGRIQGGGFLGHVLSGHGVPQLAELAIIATRGRIDAVVEPLLEGDLLPRLRTLRLAGNLSHRARSRLDAAAARTAHLEELAYR